MTPIIAPAFFSTKADFRRWLEANHETAPELLVGFWKKGRGKASIDWPQTRDQALCFGWIDGVRKSLGEEAYTIRFTPRRKGSIWSKVNVERFAALEAEGLMTPAGERALAESTGPSGVYAYERPLAELTAEEEAGFRTNAAAWADWDKRPPEQAAEIRLLATAAGPRRGFGSVRVAATINGVTWRTSIFPQKSGGYILPIKAAVRRDAGIAAGDEVRVMLDLV